MHSPKARRMWQTALASALCLTLTASPALPCAAPAMLVFDGSGSMDEITFETGPNTRIAEAREAVERALPEITPYRNVGLTIYGPGGADSCSGIDIRFPPIPDAADAIIAAVQGLRPSGLTPLSESVQRAAEVLNYRNQPGIVVLVTDGNETCGGTPCALGQYLSETAHDLTVHVIGFRAVVDFFAWNNPEQDPTTTATVARCLADLNGGKFVSTQTVDELVSALNETLGCALIGRLDDPASRIARDGIAG